MLMHSLPALAITSSLTLRTIIRPALARSASTSVDVAIIGGGIVGLATARELLSRRPALNIAVLEKEDHIAPHQSSHNSGVIHSGIYYQPGSLKARCCVEGSQLMYDYIKKRQIPHDRCGKLIVALTDDELPRLNELWSRAIANKVKDCQMLHGEEAIKRYEPNAVGLAAIHLPNTGIVRYAQVSEALAEDVRSGGGQVLTGFKVDGVTQLDQSVQIHSGSRTIEAKFAVFCGGLHADRLAHLTGSKSKREYAIIPFRGSYQVLHPSHSDAVNGMVYPVPDPSLPFLGVHITKVIGEDGKPSVYLGPNAVLAFSRQGYRPTAASIRDLFDMITFPGLWKLAWKHWVFGVGEIWRGMSQKRQLKGVARYMPSLKRDWVVGTFAGVRAQLVRRDGTLVHDFVFEESPRVLHVLNAPSPAATSSLALAKMIVDRISI